MGRRHVLDRAKVHVVEAIVEAIRSWRGLLLPLRHCLVFLTLLNSCRGRTEPSPSPCRPPLQQSQPGRSARVRWQPPCPCIAQRSSSTQVPKEQERWSAELWPGDCCSCGGANRGLTAERRRHLVGMASSCRWGYTVGALELRVGNPIPRWCQAGAAVIRASWACRAGWASGNLGP